MGLGPNWYEIGNRTCYIQKVGKFVQKKNIYVDMLEVSSFACKYVFYRPEHNPKRVLQEKKKFERPKMQKLNTPTDRA